MNHETNADPDSTAPDALQPLVLFAQDGATVTLVPNSSEEYDVVVGLPDGGTMPLAWFEATLLGRAITSAGEAAGRANTAWRTQTHMQEWTLWLAERLGAPDESAPVPTASD